MKIPTQLEWQVDHRANMYVILTIQGHHDHLYPVPQAFRALRLIEPDEEQITWCLGRAWYTLDYVENHGAFAYDHIRRDPKSWLSQYLPAEMVDDLEITVDDRCRTETGVGSWALDNEAAR